MNTSLNQRSAEIYEFPARGREALGDRRPGDTKAACDQKQDRVIEAASGWYHAEAIRESQPSWEH